MISFSLLTIFIDFLWIVITFEKNINDYSISTLIPIHNQCLSKKYNLKIKVVFYNNNTLLNKLKKFHKDVPSSINILNEETSVDQWTTHIYNKGTMLKTDYISNIHLPKSSIRYSVSKISRYSTISASKSSVTKKHNKNPRKNNRSAYSTQVFYKINLENCKQNYKRYKFWPVTKPLIKSTLTYYKTNYFTKLYGTSKIVLEKYINNAKRSNQIKMDQFWHVTTTEIYI